MSLNSITVSGTLKEAPEKRFTPSNIPVTNILLEVSYIPRGTQMTSEGTFRDLYFELKDLRILETAEDELNQNKQKIKINFNLPKSCYATVLIEFILQSHILI